MFQPISDSNAPLTLYERNKESFSFTPEMMLTLANTWGKDLPPSDPKYETTMENKDFGEMIGAIQVIMLRLPNNDGSIPLLNWKCPTFEGACYSLFNRVLCRFQTQ
jgi:hypothetical protein